MMPGFHEKDTHGNPSTYNGPIIRKKTYLKEFFIDNFKTKKKKV